MTKLLIALLATSLLVAGCGGDDENGDATEAATTAQTQPQSPTDSGEDTTPTDEKPRRDGSGEGEGTAPRGTPRELEQAVEACRENVQQAPQISKEAKQDLVDLCEQAATGDPEDLREVSKKVCERIIEDTLPAGEQREQALKLCEQTGEQ